MATFHQIMSNLGITRPMTHAKYIHGNISPVNKDKHFVYQRPKHNKKPPNKIVYITVTVSPLLL